MPDPLACYVLLSHNYAYYIVALQALLKSPAPYIGRLGPRQRAQCERLPNPTGLDWGSDKGQQPAVAGQTRAGAVLTKTP